MDQIIKYKLTDYPDMINAVYENNTWTTFRIGCGELGEKYQKWLDEGNIPEVIRTQEEIDLIKSKEYIYQRKSLLPPIEEQLDMIYWDKMNGTNEWIDLITSIKTTYPKP